MHFKLGQRASLESLNVGEKLTLSFAASSQLSVVVVGLNHKRIMFDLSYLVFDQQTESQSREYYLQNRGDTVELVMDLVSLGLGGIHEVVVFISTPEENVQNLRNLQFSLNNQHTYQTSTDSLSNDVHYLGICRIYYKKEWKIAIDNNQITDGLAEMLVSFGLILDGETLNTRPNVNPGPIIDIRAHKNLIQNKVRYEEIARTSSSNAITVTFNQTDRNKWSGSDGFMSDIICSMVDIDGKNVVGEDEYLVFFNQTNVPGVRLSESGNISTFQVNKAKIGKKAVGLLFYLVTQSSKHSETQGVEEIKIEVDFGDKSLQGNFVGKNHGDRSSCVASLCLISLNDDKLIWLPKSTKLGLENCANHGEQLLSGSLLSYLKQHPKPKEPAPPPPPEKPKASTNTGPKPPPPPPEKPRASNNTGPKPPPPPPPATRPPPPKSMDSGSMGAGKDSDIPTQPVSNAIFGKIHDLARFRNPQGMRDGSLRFFYKGKEVFHEKKNDIKGDSSDSYQILVSSDDIESFQPAYTKFTFQLNK